MVSIVSDESVKFLYFIFIIMLCFSVFTFSSLNSAEAYYGSSLYGSGSYGLYGLGGLYGGLYGMSSLYGLGGLYGMSGLYGLGGLYGGLGGLYGLGGGLYGLGGLGGMFGSLNLLSNLGLLNIGGQGALAAAPVVAAEQAGTWTGTWYSLIKLNAGIMNMSLIEDEINGALIGEVNLILNKFTNSIPAEISGLYDGGTSFVLTGGNNTVFSSLLILTTTVTLYEITLTCTLTSPTTMTGTYYIKDLTKLLSDDYGNFNLTLTAPAI
ncbi:MAG: hypothetical protein ACMUIM_00115 [bacterium]